MSWPGTGPARPSRATLRKPSATQTGGRCHLAALAPAEALGYFAQALNLYPQASDPDPALGIDLLIGLGTAQRQTGDPAFRTTLLNASRQADRLGDMERLVAAALANNRGLVSASGSSTPTRSRSWNWRSTGSRRTALIGRSSSQRCVPNSPLAARSTAARRWRTRQSVSHRPPATTPSSCRF